MGQNSTPAFKIAVFDIETESRITMLRSLQASRRMASPARWLRRSGTFKTFCGDAP
jgi:hypothetical protein